MTKVAVWGSFGGMSAELPKALPNEDVVVPKEDGSDLARVADVECAVGTNNAARVRMFLAAAPKLRWYHSLGAGVDGLMSVTELRGRGITLTNNSGSYDIQIAEHVIAFVLSSAKRLHQYRDQQGRHEWKEHQQEEVRDATLVVYGVGSIGAEVARLAAGLGMRVIGVRRRDGAVPGVSRVVPPEKLADVAAEADYLVVAAPLTSATRGAISREVIGRMKKTAWVINIARGAIIDQTALAEAARERRIGGAALDTFDPEPLPADSPLWSMENVIVTPHSSNSSPRLRQRSLALFLENLRRFKAHEPMLNVVDLDAGY